MTLSETDRLIRKLRETLKNPDAAAAAAGASSPAQAYTDACSAAQRRLEQCAAMLDAGDEQQALELAETNPPVLDLLTLLAFGESEQWREFCRSHSLPAPEPFDSRIVSRLNGLYSKGITVQHPLYRDYRAHVMRGRSDEAGATLRSITRLNPADTNAREELARLEEKRLATRLEQLAKALAAGDTRAAVLMVDSIEDQAQTASLSPAGPVWQRGLAARADQLRREASVECLALLPQLDSLRALDKWQPAASLLAHARSLQTEHGFDLDPAAKTRFDILREWTARSQAAQQRRQAFDKAVAELEYTLEQSDARQAAGGTGTLPVLQAELAGLHSRWREFESFEQPPPDGLEPRYRKRTGIVRMELDRARKRRTFALAGSCALAALLCAAGIYFFVQQQKSTALAREIDGLVTSRQVGAASRLLDAVAKDPARTEGASAKAAVARAQAFLEAERGHQKSLATHLSALESLAAETPRPFASRPLPDTSAQFESARRETATVAPEFRPPDEARLAAARNHWEAFLAGETTTINANFSKDLTAAEARADAELNYRFGEKVNQSISEIGNDIAPLAALVGEQGIPGLAIRGDLATRFDALSHRLQTFGAEVKKYQEAAARMDRAASVEEYVQALRSGQETELGRSSRDLAPAKRLLTLPVSDDALLAGALMPGNKTGWAFFKGNPDAGLIPASEVLDPEQRVYDQLLVDSNIRNVWLHPSVDSVSGKKGTIYARGQLSGGTPDDTRRFYFGTHGTFYNPTAYPATLNFSDGDLALGVSVAAIAPDTQAFQDLRFRDLIDPNIGHFTDSRTGAPIQEFLDRLTRSRASSVFKAYVFWNVYQLMYKCQREGFFGMPYSPALSAHFKEAEAIGLPNSGYWMVPEEIRRKGPAFDALFSKAAKISYAQQARLLRAAVRDAYAGGVSFRGYADAAGHPRFGTPVDAPPAGSTLPPPPDLWGWEAREGRPARLFAWSGAAADAGYHPVQGSEALPLTPLCVMEANARDILRNAARQLNISDQELKAQAPYLPPFFRN